MHQNRITSRVASRLDRHAEPSVEAILGAGAIRMLFQPIVALESGCITAFEALIRPTRGFEGAPDFLAAAARRNCLPAVDRLAHSVALASAAYLPDDASIFLNASPAAFTEHGFADRIARVAVLAGVAPSRIVIEITELGSVGNDTRFTHAAADLRRHGFDVAIDDVGAGQSDLSRILKLRPDWIKLDRSLVQCLVTDRYNRTLIAALVRFARANAIRIVAEGIELPSEARVVGELGIDFGQGYWFAQPASIADASIAQAPDRVQRRWRALAAA